MAARPTSKPVNDWEPVSGNDLGDWETVSSAAPNAGLAPPASPAAPQPLQQNPNWGTAAREGTLKDLMLNQAQPIAQSAQMAIPAMNPAAANRGLATGISGLGKTASWTSKFIPLSRFSHASEAIDEASQGLAGKIRNYAQGLESQTARYPRQALAEQMAAPPATAQRAAQIPQPKPSVGRYQPPERVTRTPRPDLIKQMGGRPVEEISDAAVKEKMEQSSEVTYGKFAKRHAAGGSATYPEPENWQDQPPEQAPWGGRFFRK